MKSRRHHVFFHPALGHAAVKEGFSWPGFFLTWIWAFSKRMWTLGAWLAGFHYAGTLVLGFLLWFLAIGIARLLVESLLGLPGLPPLSLCTPIGLALAVTVGLKGNRWLCERLPMAGYEYLGVAETFTPEAAIANAIEGRLQQTADDEQDLGGDHDLDAPTAQKRTPPYLLDRPKEVADYEQDLDVGAPASQKEEPPYLQDYRDVDLGLDSDD